MSISESDRHKHTTDTHFETFIKILQYLRCVTFQSHISYFVQSNSCLVADFRFWLRLFNPNQIERMNSFAWEENFDFPNISPTKNASLSYFTMTFSMDVCLWIISNSKFRLNYGKSILFHSEIFRYVQVLSQQVTAKWIW